MIIGTLKRWKLAADCPYVVFRNRVKSRGGKQMTAKGGTVGAWVIEGGRGGTLLLNCLLKFAKIYRQGLRIEVSGLAIRPIRV
jgi:hypothetical protein